jgi:hypothetical protein
MANFDFTSIRETALRLVKEFGNYNTPAILLRTVEADAPDASLPWRRDAPTSILEFPFIGYDSTIESDTADQDKFIIAPGDLATTGATGSPDTLCGEPTVKDRILLDGEVEYAILNIVPIRGAGVPIIYKMKCRAWQSLLTQPSTPY